MSFGKIAAVAILLYLATSSKANNLLIDDNNDSSNEPIIINYIVDQLPKHPTKTYNTRSISSISNITVHHSATTSGSAFSYANTHVNSNDWPAIGYHFVIDKDGTINQTNELTTISYHAGTPAPNNNNVSVGICLTGNFDIQQPTFAQEESLILLIRYISRQVNKEISVFGHRDFKNTSCPGANIDTFYYQQQAYNNAA